MAERDAPFLTRWSRRKRAGGAAPRIAPSAEPPPEPPPSGVAATEEGAPAAPGAPPAAPVVVAPADEPVAVEDLPDIESLGRESDYTPFLRKGVPEHLTRRALRKLWLSDPVFANLDGLNDYDEDFAKPFIESAGKVIKTYWTAARDEARAAASAAEDEIAPAAPPKDDGSSDASLDESTAAAAEDDEAGDDGGSRGI